MPVSDLPESMKNVELTWEPIKIKEILHEKQNIRFDLIPALMARKFARKKRYLKIDKGYSGELPFAHVCFDSTHECMSELIGKW
ncbi:MAG TPA: hypothetical protein VK072_09235 [Candidatus Avamphibacillus sp.]|nr:hypothetical protein [Candidatus Avamphibacillus sp.]